MKKARIIGLYLIAIIYNQESMHGFKAFINAIRLFCCLVILLNAKGDTEP